jgi:hypothetical protein
VAVPSVHAGAKNNLRQDDVLLGQSVIGQQQAQGELDDLGHLFGSRGQGGQPIRDRHDRSQLEIRNRDPDRIQSTDNPNHGVIQANLFVRLAQRGCLKGLVAWVHRPSGQAHLPGWSGSPGWRAVSRIRSSPLGSG